MFGPTPFQKKRYYNWSVKCSILSDDQQSHVGNDIEDQKENFEQPEERVNDQVEGFSGNGEPFALCAIH